MRIWIKSATEIARLLNLLLMFGTRNDIEAEWDLRGVIDKVWLIGNHVVHRRQYVQLAAISILRRGSFFLRYDARQNEMDSFCCIKRDRDLRPAQFIYTNVARGSCIRQVTIVKRIIGSARRSRNRYYTISPNSKHTLGGRENYSKLLPTSKFPICAARERILRVTAI